MYIDHGYCAKDSWIRGIFSATFSPYIKKTAGGYPASFVTYADDAGPFHPTKKGQGVEASGTIPEVCRTLYNGDPACNAPKQASP